LYPPLIERAKIKGRWYVVIKGERCLKCDKYKVGSIFFYSPDGPDDEKDFPPLMKTRIGYKVIRECENERRVS